MTFAERIIAVFCAACALGVVYAYALYPLVVWTLARLFGRKPVARMAEDAHGLPTVDLLIAAHNEEAVIADRVRNALSLDYPADKCRVVIASDASTDTTNRLCARFDQRVHLLAFEERRGKAGTLNAAMEHLKADIVVLSDANTFMDPDALRKLVRWFNNERVGVVCGSLVLTDPTTGKNVDGLYWKYETFLKVCEARLGALLGSNGAIYAIRRSLLKPIPANTIVDDFVIPLRARLESGCEIVYDDEAVAREESAPDVASEFRRRIRIGTGGLQAMAFLSPLLHPRWGWTAFALWSHKVMRWVGPFFLLGMLVSSISLSRHSGFFWSSMIQVAAYVVGGIVWFVPTSVRAVRPARVLPMFMSMNAALMVGCLRWWTGRATGVWSRTPRSATQAAVGR